VRETNPLGAAPGRLLAVSRGYRRDLAAGHRPGDCRAVDRRGASAPGIAASGPPGGPPESPKPCQRYRRPDRQPSLPRSPPEAARHWWRRAAGAACRARSGSVVEFMLACLPRKRGRDAPVTAIYARYVRWCAEHQPPLRP
jgi:hypothetical protein